MRRKRVHRGRSSRDQPEKVPTSGNGRDAAPAARAPVQDFQAPSQTPTCSPRSSSFKIRNGAKIGPGLYYRGTRVPVDRACVAQQHSCVVLNKHTATKLTFLVVAAMHLQMIASIQSCRPTCKPSRYAPCASDLTDLLLYSLCIEHLLTALCILLPAGQTAKLSQDYHDRTLHVQ